MQNKNIWGLLLACFLIFTAFSEYNKTLEFENGYNVILTYTTQLLYKLGGVNTVLFGHLLIGLLVIIGMFYNYIKNKR
ncbi:hypothetical protein [Pasteurella atlantica]|uniref:hypothetical protein n=1 Tax=Pasteurellaceae TaxID=712 RepID=UPI00276AE5D9|nr:hypothetical protein [Pasteurella atlantica]MDP8099698.1 hypothetical protein [Pasteurella atlantica]MDP8107650.1 hypothetical protein [Pasteurella atlantica]MDP8117344.1 hypothetical protein [Pasteurella atlantica]